MNELRFRRPGSLFSTCKLPEVTIVPEVSGKLRTLSPRAVWGLAGSTAGISMDGRPNKASRFVSTFSVVVGDMSDGWNTNGSSLSTTPSTKIRDIVGISSSIDHSENVILQIPQTLSSQT